MYNGQALAPSTSRRRIIGGRQRSRGSVQFIRPVSEVLVTGRERARRISRRILRVGLAAGLVGMLSAGIQNAYSSLQGSDLFRLDDIAVVGNRLLTEDQVIARAGLKSGGNLFEADIRAATDSLEAHPLVRQVLLLRQPPASLVISLEERAPVALVSRADGICGLDAEGHCFPLPTVPLNLPVVTGLEKLATEEAEAPHQAHLQRLAGFMVALRDRDADLWEDISEINVVSRTEGKLILVGDGLEVRVMFREPDVVARNLSSFFHANERPAATASYVDLRFENQIVVGHL